MLRKAFKYLLFIYCKKTSTLTTQAYFQKKKKNNYSFKQNSTINALYFNPLSFNKGYLKL